MIVKSILNSNVSYQKMTTDQTKYIQFCNNTDLPILIDSWIDDSNMHECIRVDAKETRVIHSSVGEWHLHTMFDCAKDIQLWKEKGLEKYNNIGKFRSMPCALGNYSWMESARFQCVYSEETKNVKSVHGLITFSQKINK